MAEAGKTATHSDPVGRERTNFIIRVDLTPFGLPGSYEQLWTRTEDEGQTYEVYEVCCIPFFTYGIALGDRLTWDEATHQAEVVERSEHRCIRVAFQDKAVAMARHQELHGALIACGVLIEFNSEGYWALDIGDEAQAEAVVRTLAPWVNDASLTWEWADL